MKSPIQYILISVFGVSLAAVLTFNKSGASDVVVITPPKVDLKKEVTLYQLPYRNAETDPLAGAVHLKQLADENPADPAGGEAYYTAGILFSQVAQWNDAIQAYSDAVNTGKLSPFQEITAIYSAAQCKKNQRDFSGSLEGFQTVQEKINNDGAMSAELGNATVKNQTPYFNSVYGLAAGTFLEIIDLYEDMNQYDSAVNEILAFLNWFDAIHKEKKFFQVDRDLDLDSSSPFVDRAANLCLKIPNQENRAIEIYATHLEHWTVNNNERFLYELAIITQAPNLDTKSKLTMTGDLINKYPNHFFLPQAKHNMANYARLLNDKKLAVQIWKELSVLEGDQNQRFKSINQAALLDLANYYLEQGDATTGELYLKRIKSEYSGSFAYQLATDMGLWKWPNEIRAGMHK